MKLLLSLLDHYSILKDYVWICKRFFLPVGFTILSTIYTVDIYQYKKQRYTPENDQQLCKVYSVLELMG